MSEDDAIIQAVRSAIDWALPGEEAKAAIAAYLASLEAMGWAVVRKRADSAMCRAMDEADEETLWQEVWAAGVAASPKPPGLTN